MKFDASTISAAKRAEWQQVELDCALNAPPVGAPATFNGMRMIWFFNGELHVDGYVFAECYGMPPHSEQAAITERVERLLGKVRIVFDAELPRARR
jgi:hypothetical protein